MKTQEHLAAMEKQLDKVHESPAQQGLYMTAEVLALTNIAIGA